MITWLVGENTFEIREALQAIAADFSGDPEKIDAADISLQELPNLIMGVSLFAHERLVIIRDITANAAVWEKLPDWLPRVSDDIRVVFVDTKPDKRTSSYKALKAASELREFPAWTDRDTAKAEQWVAARAEAHSLALDRSLVRHLVSRVGVDQWQLASALDVLALLDSISLDAINAVIPAHPQENIFQLFETALEGKAKEVAVQVRTLSLQEDPYALFALLSSQTLTLAAVAYGEEANPAKDFGIHPFVASKLARHAKKLGRRNVAAIVELFAQTDADMKRSKGEPWLLIERTLLRTAQVGI